MSIRLFPCPACGKPIAIDSELCPYCEHSISFWEGATAWKKAIKNIPRLGPSESVGLAEPSPAVGLMLPCDACGNPFDADGKVCPRCAARRKDRKAFDKDPQPSGADHLSSSGSSRPTSGRCPPAALPHCTAILADREVFDKDPRPSGADHLSSSGSSRPTSGRCPPAALPPCTTILKDREVFDKVSRPSGAAPLSSSGSSLRPAALPPPDPADNAVEPEEPSDRKIPLVIAFPLLAAALGGLLLILSIAGR